MNTNMTGFRWFSKIFASLCFVLKKRYHWKDKKTGASGKEIAYDKSPLSVSTSEWMQVMLQATATTAIAAAKYHDIDDGAIALS